MNSLFFYKRVGLFLILFLCVPTLGHTDNSDLSAHDWIVRFDVAELYTADMNAVVEQLNSANLTVDWDHISLPAAIRLQLDDTIQLEKLRPLLEVVLPVRYIEPNYRWQPVLQPNDPEFAQQWGLRNIRQTIQWFQDQADGYSSSCDQAPSGNPDGICDVDPVGPGVAADEVDIDANLAWDISTGDAQIRIAVIDSGIDLGHPDFESKIWRYGGEDLNNPDYDFSDAQTAGAYGWDACDGDALPEDIVGHGTQVAGVIGAEGDDGYGMAGVIWDVELLPVRFLFGPGRLNDATDCDLTTAAIEGLEFVRLVGADVVNMSWGGPEASQALLDKLEQLAAEGVVLVAGAGNEGQDFADQPFYPAAYDIPQMLSVGAHTNDGNLAAFSNWGASVNIAAPGASIRTAEVPFDDVWDFVNFRGFLGTTREPLQQGSIVGTRFSVVENGTKWGIAETTLNDYLLIGDIDAALDTPARAHGSGLNQTVESDSVDAAAWGEVILGFTLLHDLGNGSKLELQYCADCGGNWQALPDGKGVFSGTGFSEPQFDFRQVLGSPLPTDLRIRFVLTTADAHDGDQEQFVRGGVNILDVAWTKAGDDYNKSNKAFVFTQGTSLAAPFVAGTAGLVRSVFPGWSPSDVVQQIVQRAKILPQPESGIAGDKMLNAANALSADPLLVWLGNNGYTRDGVEPDMPTAGTVVTFQARLLDPENQTGGLFDGAVELVAPGEKRSFLPIVVDTSNNLSATTTVQEVGAHSYRFVVTTENTTVPGDPAEFMFFDVSGTSPTGSTDTTGSANLPDVSGKQGCGCSAADATDVKAVNGLLMLGLILLGWRFTTRYS